MSQDRKAFKKQEADLLAQLEAQMGMEQPKLKNEAVPKRKRTGSDSRFDNADFLAKVEQETIAGLEAMLSAETAQKPVKEESKSAPKMKRCGSDTRFDNTAYLAK